MYFKCDIGNLVICKPCKKCVVYIFPHSLLLLDNFLDHGVARLPRAYRLLASVCFSSSILGITYFVIHLESTRKILSRMPCFGTLAQN